MSLAGVQLRGGEIQDADRTVRSGLAHIPDSGLLYWTAGIVAVVSGHDREAEPLLKKESQLSPSREVVAATLGIFYDEQGRFIDARELLKRCIESFPSVRGTSKRSMRCWMRFRLRQQQDLRDQEQ